MEIKMLGMGVAASFTFTAHCCYIPSSMSAKKPRISPQALTEIEDALRDYAREVIEAGLGEMATNLYIDKADYFVRWLKGDFAPGMRKKNA